MTAGRDESEEERADRKLTDLLQELRVMQTGTQLIAGFLLTLPFQEEFKDLATYQVGLYLGLVLLAAVTTALVMSPVAIHRRLSGQHRKARVVDAAHRITWAALACIALLVAGIVMFVFDVVVDLTWALVAGSAMLALLVVLLGVVPRLLDR